jgi:hypothetical protein
MGTLLVVGELAPTGPLPMLPTVVATLPRSVPAWPVADVRALNAAAPEPIAGGAPAP